MDFSKERLVVLKNEIKMAEAVNREELLPIMKENLHRYIGDFVPEYGGDWDINLNEIYPVIQNNLPSTFFRNPRAFLKPRNKTYIVKKPDPLSGKKVDTEMDSSASAKTQEHILNYSILEMGYKKQTRKTLLDALIYPYGVLWHGYKGDFGFTEEKSLLIKNDRAFVQRLCPLNFLHDPTVTIANLEEGKWVGRAVDIPLQELVEDDKLDVDKKLIKGFKGFGEKIGYNKKEEKQSEGGKDKLVAKDVKKPLLEFADKTFQNSDDAKFVRIYEIYHRPTKKEKREGKKGWILLLTDEQEKLLRESEWKIKAEGFPSHILEFNELPDNLFGLSDIDIYKQAADQKNIIVNLQLRNAQENCKTYIGISKEAADEESIAKVQSGLSTIVTYDSGNPRDKMYIASAGGQASSELYLIDGRIQKNLEDKSGVTDLKRGFLQSGEESAASVKIRNAGGAARPAYRQDIMADFLRDSLHYINQLNKQFIPYDQAVRIVGSLDLQWSENPTEEELQADTDVEIDVISMLPENPEKELQELNTMLILMFQGLTQPEIKQKILEEGKTINISPIIEQMLLRMRLKDPDIFRNIKPGEAKGYVSIQQMEEAKANVQASITGQQVPYPPTPQDDHRAKLEVYTTIQGFLKMAGQVSDTLEQLIQIQMALLQKQEEKQANPGQTLNLKGPQIQTIGG